MNKAELVRPNSRDHESRQASEQGGAGGGGVGPGTIEASSWGWALPMATSDPQDDKGKGSLRPIMREDGGKEPTMEKDEMGRRRSTRKEDGLSPEMAAEKELEEGEKGREPRAGAIPSMPSKMEREQHELTHTPYRSWRQHCVRARGRNRPHQKNKNEEEELPKVPRINFDYFFFSHEEEQANQNPMIVMVDEETGEVFTNKVFDREGEDGKTVSVTVKAIDSGEPSLEGVCSFTVEITDVNDNPPLFDRQV